MNTKIDLNSECWGGESVRCDLITLLVEVGLAKEQAMGVCNWCQATSYYVIGDYAVPGCDLENCKNGFTGDYDDWTVAETKEWLTKIAKAISQSV